MGTQQPATGDKHDERINWIRCLPEPEKWIVGVIWHDNDVLPKHIIPKFLGPPPAQAKYEDNDNVYTLVPTYETTSQLDAEYNHVFRTYVKIWRRQYAGNEIIEYEGCLKADGKVFWREVDRYSSEIG